MSVFVLDVVSANRNGILCNDPSSKHNPERAKKIEKYLTVLKR